MKRNEKINHTMIEEDERFKKAYNDPRFARISKEKSKIKLDKRFSSLFNNNKFQIPQSNYDKYGRRIHKKENDMEQYYELEDTNSDKETKENENIIQNNEKKNKIYNNELLEMEKKLSYLNKMSKGEIINDSSSNSDNNNNSNSDTDSNSDEESDIDTEIDYRNKKEDIPLGEETYRIAVMNTDWTKIRAVDLFALFQSFCPDIGTVKGVTIYPSDYGLIKMKEEEKYGPRELWNEDKNGKNRKEIETNIENKTTEIEKHNITNGDQEKTNANNAEINNDEEINSDNDEEINNENDEEINDENDLLDTNNSNQKDDGFDMEKLRQYELQKLKYYFAVVQCDNAKTAAAIYDNCDALEYETSSNHLDLRFVPDDIDFSKRIIKDQCTTIPNDYKPAIFSTSALQQTEIELTWEQDDDERREKLTKSYQWDHADDDDFKAYLASDVSSSEDNESIIDESDNENETNNTDESKKLLKLKNKYRTTLLGNISDSSSIEDNETDNENENENKNKKLNKNNDNIVEDMEFTFIPEIGKEILKNKKLKNIQENETEYEKFAREKKYEKSIKRKEKLNEKKLKEKQEKDLIKEIKKIRKNKNKNTNNSNNTISDSNNDTNILYHINNNNNSNNSSELLSRDFNMNEILKNDKLKNNNKKLKGKRLKKELERKSKTSGLQESFKFNINDPRFASIYEKNTQFALDPVDPRFKKTTVTNEILQERLIRQKELENNNQSNSIMDKNDKNNKSNNLPVKDIKLSSLVESVKRKAVALEKKKINRLKIN